MNVFERFYSIDGEGKRTGELTNFLRFSGCSLACSYCDTAYAREHGCGTEAPTELVAKWMIEHAEVSKCKNITITGGEPLEQPDLRKLLLLLCPQGLSVNIETNGARDIQPLAQEFRPFFKQSGGELFFTLDLKAPSSGMFDEMLESNWDELTSFDVFKCVVSNEEDMKVFWDICKKHDVPAMKVISPCFREIQLADIVSFMKTNSLTEEYRLGYQLHKLAWSPDERGV
jgi:7-carboxy-7-deazaguanine synthase